MPPISGRPPSLARYPTYLATQVAKAAMRMLSDGLARHDLRLAHFGVLAALDDLGPACQQELCDVLDLDKSHMVGFVDDLEQRGLVARTRDQADRRRYRVALEEGGRELLADLHRVEAMCQAELFGDLDDAELATLTEMLRGVVARADASRLGLPEHGTDPADELTASAQGTEVPA